MSEAATILDYLNEDCWRAVLRLVPVSDVIRTERASRRWQRVVLIYLSHVRIGIGFGKDTKDNSHYKYYNKYNDIPTMTISNIHWLPQPLKEACGSFESWTYKMGHSVLAAYCLESIFDIIGENCPNLTEAMFINLGEELLMNNQHENFKRLRGLHFMMCHVSDNCINHYMTTLEELEINRNSQVTGECLMNSTNLKSLIIRKCSSVSCQHLFAASNSFGGLKKLVLRGIHDEWDDFQVLLTKTPKLEHLEVDDGNKGYSIDNLFPAVCQLRSLKHLSLDAFVEDEHLEAVSRCCPELQSLEGNCLTMTGEGLAALCRNAGPRLVMLDLAGSYVLKDNDVVACISACPNLTELNVRHTWSSCELLPRAASARRGMRARRPLRLLVDRQDLHDHPACPHQEYPGPSEEYEELEIPPTPPTRRWSPPTIDHYELPMVRRSCTTIPDGRIHFEQFSYNLNCLIQGIQPRREKESFFVKLAKLFCCKQRN